MEGKSVRWILSWMGDALGSRAQSQCCLFILSNEYKIQDAVAIFNGRARASSR